MSDKFQNKYRIPSARLRNLDYSSDAVYFITICTAKHHYYFGKIDNGKMVLSKIGLFVELEWRKSFEIRAELFCDCYVVMPNHIHAILRIENGIRILDDVETDGRPSLQSDVVSEIEFESQLNLQTDGRPSLQSDVVSKIKSVSQFESETDGRPSLQPDLVSKIKSVSQLESETDGRPSLRPTNFGVAYRPPKSISSFVAGFKSVVTANAHKINGRFGWQERFHDHVIRDNPDYQRIRDYIENNQNKWEQDKFFRGFQ